MSHNSLLSVGAIVLRIYVGILPGPAALLLLSDEIMMPISLTVVGRRKKNFGLEFVRYIMRKGTFGWDGFLFCQFSYVTKIVNKIFAIS